MVPTETWGIGEWATLALSALSFFAAVCAIYAAYDAMRRSDRNSSAATLVQLSEGFRQAFDRYINSTGVDQDYEFAELLNLYEIACAICLDGAVGSASGKLLREYLCRSLEHLLKVSGVPEKVRELSETPDTFEHLRKFCEQMNKRGRGPNVSELFVATRRLC